MEKPLVSIVCTAYNHEKFISQAIEGFLMQRTNFPYEIIIHDDASTDGTAKIIKNYAEKYPDVIKPIFQKENQYSKGIKPWTTFIFPRAKGKYIAMCEGDDYWTNPYKLQKQVDFLDANPDYAICFHNAEIGDETGIFKDIKLYSDFPWNILDTTRNEYSVQDLLKSTLCPTCSVVIRKPENFTLPEWFSTIPFGDMPLFILLTREKKIKYFNEAWAVYRRHPQSASRKQAGSDVFTKGFIRMYLKLYDELPDKYNEIIKEALTAKVDELNKISSIDELGNDDKLKLNIVLPQLFKTSQINKNRKGFCTVITKNYYPYALTLFKSIEKFDANIVLHVLISDSNDKIESPFPNLKFYSLTDLRNEKMSTLLFEKYFLSDHDAFRWSMKSVFMKYLLIELHLEKLIYVDSDIHFFNDYHFLFDYLDTSNILLTPHWRSSSPSLDEGNFKLLLTDGFYNAGFVGVNNRAIEALEWWANACAYKCEKSPETGNFVDQTYLDFFHYLFDGVHIIKHKGCNVANWNQVECKRTLSSNNDVLINGKYPIVFIHFTNSTIRGILQGEDRFLLPHLKIYQSLLANSGETSDKDCIDIMKISTLKYERTNNENHVLAIVCPQIGAVSETFIRKHIEFLMPHKTVVLTGSIINKDWFNGPVKLIPIALGSYSFDKNQEEDVVKFLKEHNVTHILCEFGSIGGAVVELNKNTLNLPIYVHFHGQDASEYIKIKEIAEYYKWMGNVVNGVIAVSKPMAERLIDVGIPQDKIKIIHYGVDYSEVNKTTPERSPCRFVSVSRLVGKKGIRFVLQAFEKAKKVDDDISLDIIGEGPLRTEIESFIKSHNLEQSIFLHGERQHEYVLAMMNQSSVFLQHSIIDPETGNREGLPLSILEASSLGLPVISTFHEGIPEAIEHEKTGFLVEEGDWEKMAEYIIILAKEPGLRKKMGIAGREKILKEDFTVEKMLDGLRSFMDLEKEFVLSEKKKMNITTSDSRRVLFVNHNLYPFEVSGTPISTLNHVLGVKKKGAEVAVLIPSSGIKSGYEKETNEDYIIYKMPWLDKYDTYLGNIDKKILNEYTYSLEKIINEFRPEIVHINDYVFMPEEIISIFSKSGAYIIRNVCNPEEVCHMDSPVYFDGQKDILCSGPDSPEKCAECFLKNIQGKNQDEIKPDEIKQYAKKIRRRFEAIRSLYRKHIDGVIFTEKSFKDYFIKFVSIPDENIKINPRGFMFSEPRSLEYKKEHAGIIHIGFIGSLIPRKGIDLTLKAFEKISDMENIVLDIFSSDTIQLYLDQVRNLEAKYPDKIKFHGKFNNSDFARIAETIDFALVPSNFDTFNRVVRELMYFGIPLIATDFFGASIIEDGVNGIKIKVGDSDALAESIKKLLLNPSLIEKLSMGVVATPIETIDDENEGIYTFYKEIIKKKGIKLKKPSRYDLLIEAEELIEKQQIPQAEKTLLKILSIDEDNIDAHNDIAAAYIIEKNYQQALGHIKHVLKIDKDNKTAISNLVYLRDRVDELKQLKGLGSSTPVNKPITERDVLLEAEKLIESKKYDKAEEQLNKILQWNSKNIDALNDLAVVCILKKEYEKAVELIKKVLALDYKNTVALDNQNYMLQNKLVDSFDSKKIVVGLLLATRFDKGYSLDYGPVGLGYLASSVRKELPDIQVVMTETLEQMLAQKPDLIGISSQSENYSVAINYAKSIKEKLNIPVVIGGIHVSMLPESFNDVFDVGVMGEGEVTFVELLKSILDNNGINYEKLNEINGLIFKTNGTIQKTPPRGIVKELDNLPHPVLEELPFYKRSDLACIVSSRGCPYHCTFCVSEKFSQQYRHLSAERVANDIESLVMRKGARHIVFYDDLLIADKKRLKALILILREKKLLGRIKFSCAVRANLVNEELCDLLNELNVVDCGMGVESFSDKILSYYNKKGVTGATNQHALDLLHKAGIVANPSIIFGAPVETKEDMLVTLRKIYINFENGNLGSPTWATLIPYPGTKIWDYALEKGIVGVDMEWNNYGATTKTMYLCEEVPLNEFNELIGEWLTKYSLLLRKEPNRGGSFVIRDKEQLKRKIEKVYQQIIQRGTEDLGDELILNKENWSYLN
jgi:glycosyltransferase involved in cell wall biosynthesis/radical SAM superfamily enzyme YgiQ (UPF0313 family)